VRRLEDLAAFRLAVDPAASQDFRFRISYFAAEACRQARVFADRCARTLVGLLRSLQQLPRKG
jgi:hypothetical protein